MIETIKKNKFLRGAYYSIVNTYKINKIILKEYGYLKSVKTMTPVNNRNEPIPWYTYPAIEYLNQLDLKDKNIFEFGSGYSSLFFAKKAKSVVSIEDNKNWFDKIYKNKPENLNLIYKKNKKDYLSSITKFNKKFDIIIIDASYRMECCAYAKNYLNEGGMIILDDTEREEERRCAKYLQENLDLIEVDFSGFVPMNIMQTTSIFFTRDFNIKSK